MNPSLTPEGSNAFIAAVGWINGLLAGTLASVIAVIAIASVGLLLMSGRLDVRRSTQVILGCFVIFGASTIAAGIVNAMGGPGKLNLQASPTPPPFYPTASARPSSPSSPYDPYAGAALPPRR
jgi:type IV secretory pathway VirB2 component (pilin)